MDIVEKVQLYQRFVDATVREAKEVIDRFSGSVDAALKAKGLDPVTCRGIMEKEKQSQLEDARRSRMGGTTKFEYFNFVGPRAIALHESWLNELLEEQGNEGRLLCAYFMRGDWPIAIFAKEKKPK